MSSDSHTDLTARLVGIVAERKLACLLGKIVGETPFRKPFAADILITGLATYPDGLAVICRSQEASGSTEQKFPFLLMAIRRSHLPTCLVLDGGGWSEGALAWLGGQVGVNLLGVYSVDAFTGFLAGV